MNQSQQSNEPIVVSARLVLFAYLPSGVPPVKHIACSSNVTGHTDQRIKLNFSNSEADEGKRINIQLSTAS